MKISVTLTIALCLTSFWTRPAHSGNLRPAPVLIVADPSSREAVDTAALFPEVEVVSPLGLKDLEPTWAKRRLLFLGTTALEVPAALPDLEAAAARIPVVFVSSPLVMQIKELADHESGGTLRTLGVLNQAMLPGFAIQQVDIVPNQNFGFSGNHFRLRAVLTPASRAPRFVTSSGNCSSAMEVDIFESQKLSPAQEIVDLGYPMAIACDRKNGGRLVLAGFELADIEPESVALERLQHFLHDLGAVPRK